jgi:hypothetical protein
MLRWCHTANEGDPEMIAYPAAPAVGSLVTAAPRDTFCRCCWAYRDRVGIVTAVQRDIRTGRVISVSAKWYDADWRQLPSDTLPAGHLVPWSPPARG